MSASTPCALGASSCASRPPPNRARQTVPRKRSSPRRWACEETTFDLSGGVLLATSNSASRRTPRLRSRSCLPTWWPRVARRQDTLAKHGCPGAPCDRASAVAKRGGCAVRAGPEPLRGQGPRPWDRTRGDDPSATSIEMGEQGGAYRGGMAASVALRRDVRMARLASPVTFAEGVREHQDEVYGVALRITGDRDAALDVASSTFLKAYRAFDRYDQGRPLRHWLLRIATNEAITYVRKRGRELRRRD